MYLSGMYWFYFVIRVAGGGSLLSVCPFMRPSVRPSVRLFVCSFVFYQTCEHNILKRNELILMQIGTSDPQGKGMKRSTSKVWRSKVKVA